MVRLELVFERLDDVAVIVLDLLLDVSVREVLLLVLLLDVSVRVAVAVVFVVVEDLVSEVVVGWEREEK